MKWQTNSLVETQYLAIQPLAEANIAFQKLQEQPQKQLQEQPQKQPQEQPQAQTKYNMASHHKNQMMDYNKRLSSQTPGNYVFSGSGLPCYVLSVFLQARLMWYLSTCSVSCLLVFHSILLLGLRLNWAPPFTYCSVVLLGPLTNLAWL